jgi:Na+-driven multidrug efflux pump
VMSVSMYFLVPTYHIVGAAIAVTLSNLSGFALGYGIAKWKYDLPLLECFAIRWADTRYVWRKLLKRS